MSDREIDTMNTSFIDLVCCALGSMLMLMLFVACLIEASAQKSAKGAKADAQQKQIAKQGEDGYQPAPPDPMIVTLTWHQLTKYPLKLIAYPPYVEESETEEETRFEENQAEMQKNNLSESHPFVRVAAKTSGKDVYFGFYDRGQAGDGYKLTLTIPRSRSVVADTLRRGRKKGDKILAKTHAPFWQYDILYAKSEEGNDPLLAALQAAREGALRWKLNLKSESRSTPPSPQVELSGESKAVDRPLPLEKLHDCLVNEKLDIGKFRQAMAETAIPGGGLTTNMPDPTHLLLVFRGTNTAGNCQIIGVATVDVPDEREKLLFEVVLPKLVQISSKRPNEIEIRQRAIDIAAAIDKARRNIEWEDITADADQVSHGTGQFLAAVHNFAAANAGTDPEKGVETVDVTLDVKSFPLVGEPWKAHESYVLHLDDPAGPTRFSLKQKINAKGN